MSRYKKIYSYDQLKEMYRYGRALTHALTNPNGRVIIVVKDLLSAYREIRMVVQDLFDYSLVRVPGQYMFTFPNGAMLQFSHPEPWKIMGHRFTCFEIDSRIDMDGLDEMLLSRVDTQPGWTYNPADRGFDWDGINYQLDMSKAPHYENPLAHGISLAHREDFLATTGMGKTFMTNHELFEKPKNYIPEINKGIVDPEDYNKVKRFLTVNPEKEEYTYRNFDINISRFITSKIDDEACNTLGIDKGSDEYDITCIIGVIGQPPEVDYKMFTIDDLMEISKTMANDTPKNKKADPGKFQDSLGIYNKLIPMLEKIYNEGCTEFNLVMMSPTKCYVHARGHDSETIDLDWTPEEEEETPQIIKKEKMKTSG